LALSRLRSPGLWILVAILLIAGVLTVLGTRGPAVPTALVSRTDLEQHLIVSGRVRVVTRVQLSAEVPGRVTAVRALEGRPVRKGEVLVLLDDAEARAGVAQAEAAIDQANGRVEQLRTVGAVVASEALREAETNLSRASSELARLEKLTAAGAVARTDLDEARRQVDLARARKKAAEAQQIAAAPAGADLRVALAALVESQARLAAARVRLAQTRVVAEQDGIILSRLVEPGDAAPMGATLVEMAADGETELVIEPDERNLAWVRLGQPARASADAYPATVFDAEVNYIAPAIDPARGSVEVRLRVPEPPDFLKPDMTVSVDLTVASKRQVLVVPSDAVRGAATPAPWVLVVDDNRLSRRPVTVGIRGEGSTEITSGLEDGAEVVRSADQTLADGQRVRPRREDR
jgi:HlyD family secretion protein